MTTDINLTATIRPDSWTKSTRWALSKTDRSVLWGTLICLLGVRVVLMIWFPMTDTTEARYAEIARKMLETGNWITPQYDYGVPFWGKPPLHTWASALGMKVFGVGHFGARLPILLMSFAVLWLVYVFSKRHLGSGQALICITVLASSLLFFGASAFVMTDMAMTLGTTLCMCAFYMAVTGDQRSPIWETLFFVGAAIGLLAKGPVALVLTGIPIVLWLFVGGRWNSLRRIHWGVGAVTFLGLSLPWYLAAEAATPGFLEYFIVGEHFERFVVSGWQGDLYGNGHAQPKGIIWLFAVAAFLPWSFFAVSLFWHSRKMVEEVIEDLHGWYSYLLLWSLAPMLLFTASANLLLSYTLPALPAASILVSSMFVGVHRTVSQRVKSLFLVATWGTGALYLCLACALFLLPDRLNLRTQNTLVSAAYSIDPAIELTYWGNRIYSAEFYTSARINFVNDVTAIKDLRGNSRRDAVALPKHVLADLDRETLDAFKNMGLFRERYLLVEDVDAEIRK